jgi:hypothetical protein
MTATLDTRLIIRVSRPENPVNGAGESAPGLALQARSSQLHATRREILRKRPNKPNQPAVIPIVTLPTPSLHRSDPFVAAAPNSASCRSGLRSAVEPKCKLAAARIMPAMNGTVVPRCKVGGTRRSGETDARKPSWRAVAVRRSDRIPPIQRIPGNNKKKTLLHPPAELSGTQHSGQIKRD